MERSEVLRLEMGDLVRRKPKKPNDRSAKEIGHVCFRGAHIVGVQFRRSTAFSLDCAFDPFLGKKLLALVPTDAETKEDGDE